VVNGQPARKENLGAMQDVSVVTAQDMEWADGYAISAPTRFGAWRGGQVETTFDCPGPSWPVICGEVQATPTL
tara:strand:- start:15282 stop:15500 length:219 start_codon:yes stop_codon:yes gene_type:complete